MVSAVPLRKSRREIAGMEGVIQFASAIAGRVAAAHRANTMTAFRMRHQRVDHTFEFPPVIGNTCRFPYVMVVTANQGGSAWIREYSTFMTSLSMAA
jgi:hypothetical protein